MSDAVEIKPVLRFRLLSGKHIQAHPTKITKTAYGEVASDQYFSPGDVFETDQPLDKMFNGVGCPPKFERIHDGQQTIDQANTPITVEEAARRGFSTAFTDHPTPTLSSTDVKPTVTASAPQAPNAAKGSTVPAAHQAPTGTGTLDTMSIKELQAFAAEEEIDLRTAKTRDDMLRVIRNATKG